MARLLLTGGSGFVGRHFLHDYADQYSEIIVPFRSDAPVSGDNIKLVKTKGSGIDLTRILERTNPDVIINCAAAGVKPNERGEDLLKRVNTGLPIALFEAAIKTDCRAFIQIGSMAEYAHPADQKPLKETDPAIGTNAYAKTKCETTQLLSELASHTDLNLMTLRLFGVYGPGEAPHRLTSHIRAKIEAGEKVDLSSGTQVRDFIYVKDVTRALHQAAQTALNTSNLNDIINIGSGRGISVKDFVAAFCQAGNLDMSGLDFGALPMRDTDAPYLVANIVKAKQVLDWEPDWPLDRALPDYFAA